MNYIKNIKNNQQNNDNFIKIPTSLMNFVNVETIIKKDNNGNNYCSIEGYVELLPEDRICSACYNSMEINNQYEISLKHIPFGGIHSQVIIARKQLSCTHCNATKMQTIPFKDDKHFITKELKEYVEKLLATNDFTNKDIAFITGLNRNIVKEFDKERLIKLYTKDGLGKELITPEATAKYLCIDEFKLHNGYKYATHIIDYDTGNILWIAEGKKKQVVYDFIKHVGKEWMNNVIAVACDMNSDFEEAFKEECPHLQIVYDFFHIKKNLNEKVIDEIRKDEQQKLIENGDEKAARILKRTKYILCSSEQTLLKKDQEVKEGKILSNKSDIFNKQEVKRRGNYYDRYNQLIQANEIFLTIELIKIALDEAYASTDEEEMSKLIFDIMELCEASGNNHLIKFRNLLYNHFDGIITHATHKISTGKIEGVNNKIKTLRRQAYGYPDDEYFFLKLFDMSRK